MDFYTEAADFIKHFEGFAPNAYWDVNAYRVGYGSDTLTAPDGTVRKVVVGDTTTPADAERDLSRRIRTEFEPKVISQVGQPNYSKLPDPAKIALISIAYNYGSIPKQQIVQAAQSGDVHALSQAIIDTTYNDNASLRTRRLEEAQEAETPSMISTAKTFASNHMALIVSALLLLVAALLLLIFRKHIIKTLA